MNFNICFADETGQRLDQLARKVGEMHLGGRLRKGRRIGILPVAL